MAYATLLPIIHRFHTVEEIIEVLMMFVIQGLLCLSLEMALLRIAIFYWKEI